MKRTTHKYYRLVRRSVRKQLKMAYKKIFDPTHGPLIVEVIKEIGPHHDHIVVTLGYRRHNETNVKEYLVVESFMKNDVEVGRRQKIVTAARYEHIRDMLKAKYERMH